MEANRNLDLRIERLGELTLESWLASFHSLEAQDQSIVVQKLDAEFRALLAYQNLDSAEVVGRAVDLLLALSNSSFRAQAALLLLEASFYYSRIGRGPHGLRLARRILQSVVAEDDYLTLRRIHNLLGVLEMEAADFQQSLHHLQSALFIAYRLNDTLQIAPCLAIAASALKEMGH